MIVMVFLVPESRSRLPMLYLKLNVLSCLGYFWRHLCSEMDKIESLVLLFSSFPWFWACHQHDEELVNVETSGFVVSPCNLQVFRQHSTLYLCTSGVPTTRLQYGAELFTLGSLFLAHIAMAGSASLNGEMILRVIPPLKYNGWLVLLPHSLVGPGQVRLHNGLLHTALYMQQRTFWLKWSLSLHKLQESVTPVNTVRCTRMTKRLMVTHNLILHCVVLLQLSECWKDSGQLIIPVYSIFFFFFYYIPKTLLKTRNGGTYNKRENRLRYGH